MRRVIENEVRFVLKEPTSTKATIILLLYRFANERLKYSTGQKILPMYWDSVNQRPKNKNISDIDIKRKNRDINTHLNRYEETIREVDSYCKRERIEPTIEFYRSELDKKFLKAPQKDKNIYTLLTYTEEFINQCESGQKLIPKQNTRYTYNTIKQYKGTYTNLQQFITTSKVRPDFDKITLSFYNQFVKYLTAKNFTPNSIGKNVKNLKTFLKNAYRDGYSDNQIYREEEFVKPTEDVEKIYLNELDLQQISLLDLTLSPRLDKVRDVFLIGCFTGLRFSDLGQLKPENIIHNGQIIKVRTYKTEDWVFVPLRKELKEIMAKYNGTPPQPLSNQKMNEYLKEVALLANITELVQVSQTKGGLRVDKTVLKWQLVSTHTARRSFATNAYLSGLPAIDIMKLTGHKTETSFLRYLKVTREETALRLLNHPFFTQSEIRIA